MEGGERWRVRGVAMEEEGYRRVVEGGHRGVDEEVERPSRGMQRRRERGGQQKITSTAKEGKWW